MFYGSQFDLIAASNARDAQADQARYNGQMAEMLQTAQKAQMRQDEEMARQYRRFLKAMMPRVDAGPSLPIIPRKRKD